MMGSVTFLLVERNSDEFCIFITTDTLTAQSYPSFPPPPLAQLCQRYVHCFQQGVVVDWEASEEKEDSNPLISL